ncbi:DegV family protein [Fructilactobacillus fructivorans]|uniref:DegV family protein n=1 Tax=Fructilactobacillus fructivorans TaxID=1614 RepID=A0A0C1Q3U4_9LACO|nr:DegV family protein [Fructilactobacillus fructivorans]KID42568.1 DegV family protein [Fructilactobacillus fructivorans]MCT0151794.1 DegV family protein [Fructilactobacillus fructivorans]MCT2868077.1 DegV family protein [Fructilactobacillus fructivorans]MCT2868729.1 DegV family protein [Fructilactobacillus fructivorans]MCT2873341.1 DegV family protein [Fructilactobacillus fructivorans]
MKTAIVTDSTSYLSKEDLKKYNVHIIPISVILDGKDYREGIDITNDEFYKKLQESTKLPTTSQPPIGALVKEYNKLADEGYDAVISIHLASTISGMYQAVCNVSKMMDNIQIYPFNSGITVDPMAALVKYAAKLAQEGVNPSEIIDKLKRLRSTIDELIVVDDLDNLVKGGRLSNASAFVGGLLNIKPILTFDNQTDEIVAFDKVRSKKKALKRVEDLFSQAVEKSDYPIEVAVIDANNPKEADIWQKTIQDKYPNMKVSRGYFGPAIGTHLGSGALALGWIRDMSK